MKKLLQMIALVALMAAPIGASATTDTLTVANGTMTNSYVPIYGYWADAAQHNQMIYPASMLDSMIGQNITGLTFFVTGNWSCDAVVRLAVVSDSTLTGLINNATFVQVWSGMWNSSTSMDFLNAFAYNGGNLLVDIQTQTGSYGNSSATGVSRNGASYYDYGSAVQNFLPKAQFVYSDDVFCFQPIGLTYDTATTGSLSFHWSAGGTETMWDVKVGDSVIYGITDTFVTVYDLDAATRYNVSVRAVCSSDNSSAWYPAVSMVTGCAAITTLPWSYGFEGDMEGDVPVCWSAPSYFDMLDWDNSHVIAPAVYTSSYYAHTGNNLFLYQFVSYYGTASTGPAITATPYFNHTPTDLHVTFWFNGDSFTGNETFEAGVMTNPTDTSTFIPVLTITGNNAPAPSMLEFYTSGLTVLDDYDSVCVAFRATIDVNSTDYFELVIDDITVDAIGDCLAPTLNSGVVDSLSYESVELSWQCASEPDGFDVMLIRYNATTNSYDTTHHATTDTTIQIGNLLPDTYYEAYAASLCSGDTTDYVSLGGFTTHLRCYSVQNAACVALTANAASFAWTFTGTGIEPASVEIVLTDLTNSTVAPVNVSVSGATTYTFTGLTEGNLYSISFMTLCGTEDSSSVVTLTFMPVAPPCAEVNGTSTNSYVPFYSFYNNGFSESLYDATIIDGIDTVNGLALQVASELNRNNILDIYMGYTTLSNLSGSTYVPVAQLTHVVTNYSLNTGSTGWTDVIPFDVPFLTQPAGDSLHLIIAFYNHTGSYTSGLVWTTHTSAIGNSVYYYTDDAINVNTNPLGGYGSTTPMAPNIQLYGNCGGSDCVAPSINVSATDTSSATLAWLPGSDETSWVVQYRANGTTTWTTAGTATSQPYVITGLTAGTQYQFRLGSNCTDTVVYSTAVSASTACGTMHAPFFIFPDGTNNCWTFNGNGYYSSYDNAYEFYTGASIITPAIADSINTLQVSVKVYGSTYYVGVCDGNGQNITWMDTIDPLYDGIFKTKKTYLDSYTGTGNHVIIKASSGYNYTYIQKITIEPLETCMPIDSLTLDSVGLTEAWFSWVSDGSSFDVYYHAESDTTDTWQTTTSTTNGVHLTGLNSNDRYYVKVFNVCSATEHSDSVMMRIATGCTNFTTPFAELFGHGELPVCWSAVAANTEYGWEYSAEWAGNEIYSEGDYNGNPANDWLMTPVIQLPANTDYYQLIFYAGGGADSYSSGSFAGYEVRISTNGSGDTATYTTLLLNDTVNTYNAASYSYTLYDTHIGLSAYAGQAVSFAFVNRSRNYGIVYIANVEVRETVSPRYRISGPSTVFLGDTGTYYATYLEGALDSMNLQWTSTMAAAGQAVMTNATTDTMQIYYTADGVDTITFIATNQYNADTNRMIVRVVNIAPVNHFPYTTDFEGSDNNSWVFVNGANAWNFGTATNNSGTHSLYISENGGITNTYDGNATSISYAYRVFDISDTGTYTTQFDWRCDGESNYDYLRAFFVPNAYFNITADIYPDGSTSAYNFSDADVTGWFNLGGKLNQDTSWSTQFDTIHITTTGRYFLVFLWSNDGSVLHNPAAAVDNIIVNNGSSFATCHTPVVTSIVRGETSLTVNFTSEADSVELIIVAGQQFNESAASVIATGNSHTFTGLNHSSTYTIGLRSLCSATDISDWDVVIDSTLTVNCGVPTGLNVTGTGYNSITINWTAAGEEHGWEVMAYNTLDTVFATSSTTTATVTGLMASTTYNVSVRALCGQNADIEGEWCAAIQATTDACAPVTNVAVSNISGTTADVSWTAPEGATNFRVLYGMQGFDQGGELGTYTTAESQYHLTGLEITTSYTVRVANLCTETLLSQFTSANFTTGTEGIASIDAEGNLSIYPNPASSMVTITVSEQLADATVTIVDLNGRTVNTYAINNQTITLDVSTLAKGAYFVRITGEQATAVRKLIVK